MLIVLVLIDVNHSSLNLIISELFIRSNVRFLISSKHCVCEGIFTHNLAASTL